MKDLVSGSLIVGTLWTWLTLLRGKIAQSAAFRGFERLCAWLAAQWKDSRIVGWFCSARYFGRGRRAMGTARTLLSRLYDAAGLGRAVEGSIFLQSFLWCALCAAAAPVLPTMAVLGLAMVGYGSVALRLIHDHRLRLERLPLTLPVTLYAALYLVGTLTSVDLRSSLLPGVLSVVFIGFSLVLIRAVDTKRQLDLLVAALVTVGAAVSCYGILQYIFRWGYQSAAWVDDDMFSSIRFRVSATKKRSPANSSPSHAPREKVSSMQSTIAPQQQK